MLFRSDYVTSLLAETLAIEESKPLLVRGVYVSSVYQQGVPFDAFAQAASRRYNLPEPIHSALRGESNTYFVRQLFSSIIFPEAHLAGETRLHTLYRRRRMAIGLSCLSLFSAALIGGWHYFYRVNEEAGRNVLTKAQAFAAYMAPLRRAEWVVYAKPPFGGPAAVLAYLLREARARAWPAGLCERSVAVLSALVAALGARRISVGGSLARSAWGGFMRAARQIAEGGSFGGFGSMPTLRLCVQ